MRVRMGLHTGEPARRRRLRRPRRPPRRADRAPATAARCCSRDDARAARATSSRGRPCATSASTGSRTCAQPERLFQLVDRRARAGVPAAADAREPADQPAGRSRRRWSGASASSRELARSCSRDERRPAAHADRPGRHRQDAPRAPGGGGGRRALPERRLLRRAGAAHATRRWCCRRSRRRSASARVRRADRATPRSQHLADQQLLLVLDNFEQVLDAAPTVARAARRRAAA